jgi:hypothetical protein
MQNFLSTQNIYLVPCLCEFVTVLAVLAVQVVQPQQPPPILHHCTARTLSYWYSLL